MRLYSKHLSARSLAYQHVTEYWRIHWGFVHCLELIFPFLLIHTNATPFKSSGGQESLVTFDYTKGNKYVQPLVELGIYQ